MTTDTTEALPAPKALDAHPAQTLTAHDRCDAKACGAQAYVRVNIDGSELLFCHHHFTASETAIRKVATSILDERWVLFERENPATHSKGEDHA